MQIMPVSILRYIVKSPFLVIRALKFMLSRNSVRDIERHSSYQTAWGDDCQEGEHFQSLSPAGSFFKPQLCHRASGILEAVSESWSEGEREIDSKALSSVRQCYLEVLVSLPQHSGRWGRLELRSEERRVGKECRCRWAWDF